MGLPPSGIPLSWGVHGQDNEFDTRIRPEKGLHILSRICRYVRGAPSNRDTARDDVVSVPSSRTSTSNLSTKDRASNRQSAQRPKHTWEVANTQPKNTNVEQPREETAKPLLRTRRSRNRKWKMRHEERNSITDETIPDTHHEETYVSNATPSEKPSRKPTRKDGWRVGVSTHASLMIKDCATKQGKYNGLINIISDPEFLIGCYEAIKGKPGNMTPGPNKETLDGIDKNWFISIAESLKKGQFEFSPTRRVLIPKPGKKEERPLGIAPPREKIVQKALLVVLEAIWEPMFLDSSHGFRPERSCHSALKALYQQGSNYSWAIQGDITKCFDSIPHDTIRKCLSKHITCQRTLELINKGLKAGYIDPKSGKTIREKTGTPQGSVLSPLLCNIVLHELDMFMHKLQDRYKKGTKRRENIAYRKVRHKRERAFKIEDRRLLLAEMRRIPRGDPMDPGFRRLLYIRFADDFIILIIGTRNEAIRIKKEVSHVLAQKCGLELNETKTTITHTASEWFEFLGAMCKNIPRLNRPFAKSGNTTTSRRVPTRIMIFAPIKKLLLKLKTRGIAKASSGDGTLRPTALRGLTGMQHADIIGFYQQKITGILNYYSFAGNRGNLSKVIWFLHQSCASTLALKYKLKTIRRAMKKFGKTLQCPSTAKGLTLPDNLRVTHYFNTAAKMPTPETIIKVSWANKLTKTGLGKICAICGTSTVEMHHVRSVKDIRARIRTGEVTYK